MSLAIGPSRVHGRGVFATRPYARGERIERAPVIVFPREQLVHLDRTAAYDYYFAWGEDGEDAAIPIGLPLFMNHAREPNVEWDAVLAERAIDFVARHDIAAGDELFIHYNSDPGDDSPLWFER